MKTYNTGIKATSQFLQILASVIGQMSDGIWENTRSMERYWKSLDYRVDENGYIILIDKDWVTPDPLSFFANKIKQIVEIEREWGNTRLVWDRSCRAIPGYLDRSSWSSGRDIPAVTVGDCYHLYDLLKSRNTSNKKYASLKEFKVEISFGGFNIPVTLWAFSSDDARTRARKQMAELAQVKVLQD